MMNDEILEALKGIAREKAVDKNLLVETLTMGLLSAARKRYATAHDVQVNFDEVTGEIKVIVEKKVVPVAIDLAGEIDVEEARKIDPRARAGDVVGVEVPTAEFGRNAIQTAKQVLVQRVREAERENVYNEFIDRKGQVLSGTVQQIDRGNVIVKIGKTEGIIPHREQINRDRFKIGDPVRAYLLEVDKDQKGPQIHLSRTHPEFVRRLFEQEVPEIFERVVEIRAISREPGSRTKICVVSHDDRVDPVGACVGMKGARVQNIVKELGGERIDIVPYSADMKILVSRALSPARVLDVIYDEPNEKATVVVADEQVPLAIGRGGQNARLAAKLTGVAIVLVSQSQVDAQKEQDVGVPDVDLESLTKELGPKVVEKLVNGGKETLQDVMKTSIDELMEIPGIGEKISSRVLAVGAQILEQKALEIQKEREEKAVAEAAEETDAEDTDEAADSDESEATAEEAVEEPVDTDASDSDDADGEPAAAEASEQDQSEEEEEPEGADEAEHEASGEEPEPETSDSDTEGETAETNSGGSKA